MKNVELSVKEQKKYEIIKKLVDHSGNKLIAAQKLNLLKRQITEYMESGKSGQVLKLLIL